MFFNKSEFIHQKELHFLQNFGEHSISPNLLKITLVMTTLVYFYIYSFIYKTENISNYYCILISRLTKIEILNCSSQVHHFLKLFMFANFKP